MKDLYIGNLSQEERWDIWQNSLGKPCGSYARMRDKAEYDKSLKEYNITHHFIK